MLPIIAGDSHEYVQNEVTPNRFDARVSRILVANTCGANHVAYFHGRGEADH